MNLFEKPNGTAYVLVGLPGSGKSTWREHYLANTKRKTVVLSRDDLVDEVCRATGMTYREAWKTLDHAALDEDFERHLLAAVRSGYDLIIDRTNTRKDERQDRVLRHLPNYYRRVAVVFDVPREELDRRLAAREEATGKAIPSFVVDDMLTNYVEPTVPEFHEVIRV